MSCQRCGRRCHGCHCTDCAMDLRYGNAAADHDQPEPREREYRCLECTEEYRTVDGPCPACGARRRRYVGPLPGKNQEGDSDGEAAETSAPGFGGNEGADVDEAELARELRAHCDEILVRPGSSYTVMHVPAGDGPLCEHVSEPAVLRPKDVSAIPPGYWRWCSSCAAAYAGAAPGQLDEIRAPQLATDGGTLEPRLDAELREVIDAHEAIDWTSVPEISTVEAMTWNERLREALECVSGERAESTDSDPNTAGTINE